MLWQLTTQRLPFPVPRHDPETGRTASAQIEPEAEFQVPTHLLPLQGVGTSAQMPRIDADVLVQLPLTDVGKVTFYKRDEVTTDLICCDVVVADKVWSFHEEQVGWDVLVDHLQRLPQFRADWFAAVSQPPFATSETVAFSRQ